MKDMPLLVQIGAGNIGRSLVGQLFANAGWRVAFLDVDEAIIGALNEKREYVVTVKDDILSGQPDAIVVHNVEGVCLRNREAAVDLLRRADLAGTSVGAANLRSACELVAEALPERREPLSVMLCENLHNAAARAREHLSRALPAGSPHLERVGFVEAAISKMVPSTPPEIRRNDPLAVWAEAYNTLYLDYDAYVGAPPAVFGVAWRRPFQAYVDRKLLLHNFGHAAAAYNGFLRGREYIWQCMEDAEVRGEVAVCMMETARALAIRHKNVFTFDENRAWADDLLRRFHNRALADPVLRVGRDLKRKLAPDDRCVGALRLLLETGVGYEHTARALAAAMFFLPGTGEEIMPGDREVVELAAKQGPQAVLVGLCGMDPIADAAPFDMVCSLYREMAASR